MSSTGPHLNGVSEAVKLAVDLRRLRRALERKMSNGRVYYQLSFRVGISFGTSELRARVHWTENGEDYASPMSIVRDALM